MRIGLIGPGERDRAKLREASEFLLADCAVDSVVYLGDDLDAQEMVQSWSSQIMGGPADESAFLANAARTAIDGDHEAVFDLLARDNEVRRLDAIRCIPLAPARAVEILDDRIILLVYDKALLDEDDIASATLVVYGKSTEPALHRFGPRAFYTPGPLAKNVVAVLEREPGGALAISQFDPATGEPAGRELLKAASTKLVVQS